MRRIKRRIFSGVVCEQEVYTVPSGVRKLSRTEPRIRFKDEEERAKHRDGIARRKHTRIINSNFNHHSLYSTLTFDNENEVHTFGEAKQLRERFVRRLQRAAPGAHIIIYIGRGKATGRIHYHMISTDIPESIIRAKWTYGEVVRIERLRKHNYYDGVDHGQDYTGLANYLFDHWTPEQGGHRYRKTMNMSEPLREKPTEVKRKYSECNPPPAPEGYRLVEARGNDFGYLYYKYIKIPEKAKPVQRK